MTLAEPDLSAVRAHRTALVPPADLWSFWTDTIAQSRSAASGPAVFTPASTVLEVIETFDVEFAGFAGDRVRGWLHVPAGTREPLPVVVEYVGYGLGRGLPHQSTLWAAAGFAHFVMDVRGQGSSGSVGDTDDPHPSGPAYPGVMTRGIADPQTYYYRRLITDAVRAVDAAREHPLVDPGTVVVAGISQGGGLTIAAAALADDIAAALPDVPFLCDIRRACSLTDELPYTEIARYLRQHRLAVDAVFRTLSYIDGAVLSARAQAPALFSVGLEDLICPPSTVYAAYNAWSGPKSIREYEFNGHEGGGPFHEQAKVAWLRETLAAR